MLAQINKLVRYGCPHWSMLRTIGSAASAKGALLGKTLRATEKVMLS